VRAKYKVSNSLPPPAHCVASPAEHPLQIAAWFEHFFIMGSSIYAAVDVNQGGLWLPACPAPLPYSVTGPACGTNFNKLLRRASGKVTAKGAQWGGAVRCVVYVCTQYGGHLNCCSLRRIFRGVSFVATSQEPGSTVAAGRLLVNICQT
jgi:hypothetical protein